MEGIQAMRVPSLTLFVDSKSGDWLIQSHAIDVTSRFTVATGVPRRIPADDVKTVGCTAIVEALNSFDEVCDPLPSSIDHLPRKERYRFNQSHYRLSIAQPDSTRIEVWLMKREAGGFMGERKRVLNPKAADFAVKLMKAVRELTRLLD
jgi:hypothetical protein